MKKTLISAVVAAVAFAAPAMAWEGQTVACYDKVLVPAKYEYSKAFLAKPESPGFPKLSDCDSPCLGGWIMSAPLPSALRARFQRYIEEGLSGRAAALRLKLSPATGARWRYQIQRTGRATPAVQGRPKGSGKLAPHVGFFEELIAQDPDITLFELRDALAEATGLQVQHSAIGHLLKRLGFTHKKSRWSPPNAVAPM